MTMHSLLRNLLLLAATTAAAAAAGAPPKAHQLDAGYTFEAYLAHFDKAYADPAERTRRAATFARHLAEILRHNAGKMDAAGRVTAGYVMGVNAFTDVEAEELPLGYDKRRHAAWRSQLAGPTAKVARRLGAAHAGATASYEQPPAFAMEAVSDLPAAVDWAEAGAVNPDIPNQGGCGSCWTFAAIAAAEGQLAIAHPDDPFVALSQQTMLTCAPNPEQCGGPGQCGGSTVELGLNYMADLTATGAGGLYTLADVPYVSEGGGDCAALTAGKSAYAGVAGWTQLPVNDYQAVMNAVAKVGPVAIAVAASDWAMYEGGVFEPDASSTTVNHAVLLVGYGTTAAGEKFWKVRNSWGPGFGEGGYINVRRSDDDAAHCALDDDPLLGVACALDESGNTVDVAPVEVCGSSAILFDVAYPTGVVRLG